MANLLNAARMTVTGTPGTGSVTLNAAVAKYITFLQAGAVDALKYSYRIEDGNDFEVGIGTYTASGTTFSRDTVTVSKASGTVSTSKLTLTSAAEVMITARVEELTPPDRNYCLNGALDFWQAGTSFTGISGSTTQRAADMWVFATINSGTWTVARDTSVPTIAQAGRLLNYSIKCTVTSNDATVNSADQAQLRFLVEGYDYNALRDQVQTLSFWARSNLTGTYGVGFRNDGSDRSYVGTYVINAADTWEFKTITISTAPAAGGTWDVTTGEGVRVQFSLVAGSNFLGSAGWQSSNVHSISGQPNLAATNANYIQFADVRLCHGPSTANMIIPSAAETFSKLIRYYRKTYGYAVALGDTSGSGDAGRLDFIAASTSHRQSLLFGVPMRIAPTITFYNPSSGATGTWRDGTAGADRTMTATNVGEGGFCGNVTSSVSGNIMTGHYVADARL